jgi:hypothetical protein
MKSQTAMTDPVVSSGQTASFVAEMLLELARISQQGNLTLTSELLGAVIPVVAMEAERDQSSR